MILQGKRLGFTLTEIREMPAGGAHGYTKNLPINRMKCVEQIKMLERRRRDIDRALAELRRIIHCIGCPACRHIRTDLSRATVPRVPTTLIYV